LDASHNYIILNKEDPYW